MINEKFWLAIAFAGFVLMILKYVWPHMAKALDGKSRQIAEEILAAKEMMEKATALLEDAEKTGREAKDHAAKLLADAESEAKKFAKEAEEALTAEITKRTAAANDRIKMEEENAIREIKAGIINGALKKLNEDLAKNISNDEQLKLIEKALERV